MYRVIAIVGAALALAACSSTPEWMNVDFLKPAPILDTVSFESTPPGAEAKTSNGQSCRTPCSLALPTNTPLTVSFTLTGYLPDTENLDPITLTGSETKLQPNPVVVELTPTPPPPRPVKKKTVHRHKRNVAVKKPAPKKPAAPAAPAATAAPAPQQPASPWPAPPAPKQQ